MQAQALCCIPRENGLQKLDLSHTQHEGHTYDLTLDRDDKGALQSCTPMLERQQACSKPANEADKKVTKMRWRWLGTCD